jgi:hypothetical protein
VAAAPLSITAAATSELLGLGQRGRQGGVQERRHGLTAGAATLRISSSGPCTRMSSSPGFSSMGMSLGRSFEERPKIEAQFFKNFTKGELSPNDLDSEVDRAGCRSGDMG